MRNDETKTYVAMPGGFDDPAGAWTSATAIVPVAAGAAGSTAITTGEGTAVPRENDADVRGFVFGASPGQQP